MTTGEALKRFRKRFGLSQKHAATVAGVHLTTYQKYEYDEFVPPVTSIENLADEFGVSTDYLLGRTDNPRLQTIEDNPPALSSDFINKLIFETRIDHAEKLAKVGNKIDEPAIEYADLLLRNYHRALMPKLIEGGVRL